MRPETEVICIESPALKLLVQTVVEQLRKEHPHISEKWVGTHEAMQLLGITSRTTLVRLKNEGKIRFTRATSRNTLFDRQSIEAYLEQKARNTF